MDRKLTLEQAEQLMRRTGGSLDLSSTQITALPDNLTVGGSLDLRGTQITALPDNLTVGGSLDLSSTQITALPDNLTVGGWLDLSSTQITALPDNLTVGGSLYLRGTQITAAERCKVKRLIDGTIKKHYIYADGVLFHRTGREHKIGEYTVYSGKINGQMLVTDGKLWAHCKTAKDGIADILFKRAKDRGADQYKGIDLDKPYTVEELKTMYRIITGACRAGTEAFVNSVRDLKDTYTVREALEITKGQYNAEAFSRFFAEAEA